MKKLLWISVFGNLLIVGFFSLITALFSSATAFFMLLLILVTWAFMEREEDRAYRIISIPALVPTLAFLFFKGLRLMNSELFSNWHWLYFCSVLSAILVVYFFKVFVRDDRYFRELRYQQGLTASKLSTLALVNGLFLSLLIPLVMIYYDQYC